MHIIGSAIHSWSQIYNLFPDHTSGFRENDVFLRHVSKFRMLADMLKQGVMSHRRFLFPTLIKTRVLLVTCIITPYTHSTRHAHSLICSQWTMQLIYYAVCIKERYLYCVKKHYTCKLFMPAGFNCYL